MNGAEEPLPSGGSCLLGSINLSAFVENPFTINAMFNFQEFKCAVKTGVKMLNDILDEGLPLLPLEEQKQSGRDWRQIGLGIMGLGDMLIKLGYTYGDIYSLELSNMIGHTMINSALQASALLAKKEGKYPKYNDKVLESKFFKNVATKTTIELVRKYGLRNSQLLTCAPTGSISNLLGLSAGGIEPIFATYYNRKTETLHDGDFIYKVYSPIVKEYMDTVGITDDTNLPNYFVTAMNGIEPMGRVAMQAVWQKYIDASISSTVNLPNSATVQDVADIYTEAWKQGLKGITIFRDGCARAGILTTETKNEDEQTQTELKRGDIVKVDTDLIGKKRKLNTGCGSLHCTAFFDKNTGELRETYLSKGSSGGCQNYMIGLSRMMSLAARGGISVYDIVDQLSSTGVCPSYAVRSAKYKDTSKGSCCPMAVGNALTEMYEEMQNELLTKTDIKRKEVVKTKDNSMTYEECIDSMICPECGEELISTGGCVSCKACAFSKCD